MSIQIKYGELKKNLSEIIIEILSKEYPLRIKEIHNKVKDYFQLKLSFQAVRKSLNSLVDQGKLIVEKNEYQINKDWIKSNKKLIDVAVNNYFTAELKDHPPKVNKIGEQMQVFHFENPLQTDKFLGELLLDVASKENKNILCIQALHYWYFLGHLGTESEFIQEMTRRKTDICYISFGGKTLLDNLSKNFYQQHNVKFKIITKEFEKQTEIVIIQDFIIRVQYPKDFIDKLEELFKKTKNINDLNFLEFGKLIKSNYPTSLTIFKDATMAHTLRESTLNYF